MDRGPRPLDHEGQPYRLLRHARGAARDAAANRNADPDRRARTGHGMAIARRRAPARPLVGGAAALAIAGSPSRRVQGAPLFRLDELSPRGWSNGDVTRPS